MLFCLSLPSVFCFCWAVGRGRVYSAPFGRKRNFLIEVRIENGFPHWAERRRPTLPHFPCSVINWRPFPAYGCPSSGQPCLTISCPALWRLQRQSATYLIIISFESLFVGCWVTCKCYVGRGAGTEELGQRCPAWGADLVQLSHSYLHMQNYVIFPHTDRTWKTFFMGKISFLPFGWISCHSYWKYSNKQHGGI